MYMMKRKLILSAACLLLATGAMAQTSNFRLKADLKNFGKDTLVVYKGRDIKMDTILVKDNQFEYNTYVEKPAQWIVATLNALRGTENKMIRLVAVPNENAELRGNLDTRYDIDGSRFYKEYHEMDLVEEEASRELDSLGMALSEKMKNGTSQEEARKEYEEKAPALEKAQKEKLLAFIAQHPDYEACATMIGRRMFYEVEDMEKIAGMISGRVAQGRMKDYYQPIIKQARERRESEERAAKVQATGAEVADFTLKDINGKDFTLSTLRGKYVILDFWGSWCGWCIKGMPQMKEYYKKYAGKLEIVGVDCNDTEEKWKSAVAKYELPWIHVYNVRGSDNDVSKLYAIQGYPTKIIVGPDGKIVKTVVGEDPAFYTFLDETFGK